MRMTGGLALIMFSAAFMVGCDSFSVIDLFHAPGSSTTSLTLAVQVPTVEQNTSTALFPTAGTPPYMFNVLADNLSYTGTMGTVTTAPFQYNSGTSIGTIRVRVIDAAGASADAVVTVLPPPPTSFAVVFNTSPTRGDLSWSYPNTAFITGYSLWVSTNAGASYTQLVTLGNTATAYVQNGASANYYRLYAVAGTFSSSAASAH